MIDPDPQAALRIKPLVAVGEELDCAIEFTRSLVDMALDLGDFAWAAKAASTLRILQAMRAAGIGSGRRLQLPAEFGEGRAAA